MSTISTKKLVLGGLFAALVFVSTYSFHVPYGSGYIHAGDAMVYLSGALLGPLGALAAGLGSMLSDIAAGYAAYALPTFVIKFFDGLAVALIYGKIKKKGDDWLATSAKLAMAAVVGSLVMVAGYYGFETLVYPEYALVNLPGNLIQVTVGTILAIAIMPFLSKVKY